MASHERICEWCGRPFTAATNRARYCSDRCRKAHNRYVNGPVPDAYTMGVGGFDVESATIGEVEIAEMVVRLRGIAGELSAAETTGAMPYRGLCSRLRADIVTALDREGL